MAKRRACCAALSIISPELTRTSTLSPLFWLPPTIPPVANLLTVAMSEIICAVPDMPKASQSTQVLQELRACAKESTICPMAAMIIPALPAAESLPSCCIALPSISQLAPAAARPLAVGSTIPWMLVKAPFTLSKLVTSMLKSDCILAMSLELMSSLMGFTLLPSLASCLLRSSICFFALSLPMIPISKSCCMRLALVCALE